MAEKTARKYEISPEVASAQRRVAGLGQRHNPDDPDLAEARRDLRFVTFLKIAREIRAADPPFTAEQWSLLAQVGFYPTPDST